MKVNIDSLIPHPRNSEFFDDLSGGKWEELLQSIKSRHDAGKRGNIEPIIITQDNVIVSGHQRVRAFKELGIPEIEAEVKEYETYDEILQDLIETNIRQRGEVGGSAKKVGTRIKELERIYGIQHGGDRKSDEKKSNDKNYCLIKSQSDIAEEMGMNTLTLRNYKLLADMIPELEDLLDTGIVTKSTVIAIMRELSEDEQRELIANMDVTKKITKSQVDKYIKEINDLKNNPPTPPDYEECKSDLLDKEHELQLLNEKCREIEAQMKRYKDENKYLKEDNDQYKKLQNEIKALTAKRTDLSRKISNIEGIAKLNAEILRFVDNILAPVKYKVQMSELDHVKDATMIENINATIKSVSNWVDDMRNIVNYKEEIIIE